MCSLLLSLETPNVLSSLSHRIFKRLVKALISLCVCTGWSEPLLLHISHCWKSHVMAQMYYFIALIPGTHVYFELQYEINRLWEVMTHMPGQQSIKELIQFLECSWNHEYFRCLAK